MRRILFMLVLVMSASLAVGPGEASAANGRLIRGGVRLVGREFATRLYYSNAFRSYIPGTGYGGFARPAFGYRGY